MKKAFLLLIALLFSTATFSQTFINTVGSDDSVAIGGFDTVAFFKEQKAVPGKPEFEHEYLGAKWRFSNEENLALFKADPEKYLPEWGGQCAWCVAENCISPKKISGDFAFVDGKLYLFSYGNGSKDEAKNDFMYKRGGSSPKIYWGNKNWPNLKQKLIDGAIVQPNASRYRKSRFE